MPDLPDNLQNEVREYLEKQVRSGFADLATLAHDSGEVYADSAEAADIAAFSRAALQDILIHHCADQKRWPAKTDCDRLDAAFVELQASGIVARQNFWCCGTCGLAAIGDEIEQARVSGLDVRGYTFYHEQDTEAAIDGRGIYLYYGSVDDGERHALGIAREIQEILHRHGLATEWDGTFSKRIGVTIDWKRRQP
jgi:hypothetical protein